MLDGAEVTFRLVEYVKTAFRNRKMRAVELELAGALPLGDPGKCPKVRQAYLYRFIFHVEERRAVQLRVPGPDLVSCAIEHLHPVGDELSMAMSPIVKLASERS